MDGRNHAILQLIGVADVAAGSEQLLPGIGNVEAVQQEIAAAAPGAVDPPGVRVLIGRAEAQLLGGGTAAGHQNAVALRNLRLGIVHRNAADQAILQRHRVFIGVHGVHGEVALLVVHGDLFHNLARGNHLLHVAVRLRLDRGERLHFAVHRKLILAEIQAGTQLQAAQRILDAFADALRLVLRLLRTRGLDKHIRMRRFRRNGRRALLFFSASGGRRQKTENQQSCEYALFHPVHVSFLFSHSQVLG